ncbi:MAG TPA: formylglycine-generating enzyme family protein [Dissulfurispiraceae bacterium]|nr:formylglycine-generating enzyme family protein [Dissulfurispiraceae bacterium]
MNKRNVICQSALGIMFFLGSVCPTIIHAEALYLEPSTGIEFVFIKSGCYKMGDSAGDGDPNERPVHEACVSDFYIGRYAVTNSQFRKFRPGHSSGNYEGVNLDDDNQPVINVSWEDAVDFAKWLSEKTGQQYRLPTEAEWEYAARAGTKTSRFWGNNPDDACQYANVADISAKKLRPRWTAFFCDDGYAAASPVGSFKPNGFGLYDMLGNVWQWCEDVYDSRAYVRLPKNDPVYQGAGEARVVRGGGWSNGPMGIRSAHRVGLTPTIGHRALGFRLVREAK